MVDIGDVEGMSTDWQNRLSNEIKLVPANQLLANPSNPRRHPAKQREALRGSLDTLGFVAPILVSKHSQFMLDGHARVEEALSKDENTLVPVLEVDLEAHEESLFLASFDYITYMAEYDRDALESLLHDVNTDDNRLQAMLSELASNSGIIPTDSTSWDSAFGNVADEDRAPFQQKTFTLHDSQAVLVDTAIKKANSLTNYDGSPNENSNGNALAYICEWFINAHE